MDRKSKNPSESPARLAEVTGDQDTDEDLFKRVEIIFIKAAIPDWLNALAKEFIELQPRMNTLERVNGVVHVIFAKLNHKPMYCQLYGELCERFVKHEREMDMRAWRDSHSLDKRIDVKFRFVLLTICQLEFEEMEDWDSKIKQQKAAIASCEKAEDREILQKELETFLDDIRDPYLNAVMFSGELYHRNMLTAKTMHHCVSTLLEYENEVALEAVGMLLDTVGKKLQVDRVQEFPGIMDKYRHRRQQLSPKFIPSLKLKPLASIDLQIIVQHMDKFLTLMNKVYFRIPGPGGSIFRHGQWMIKEGCIDIRALQK